MCIRGSVGSLHPHYGDKSPNPIVTKVSLVLKVNRIKQNLNFNNIAIEYNSVKFDTFYSFNTGFC
jgi:hypothetical protein